MISGGDDETTTSNTELPEMTEEEKKLMGKSSALIDAYLTQSGYEMEEKRETIYENPERWRQLNARRDELQQKKLDLQAKIEDPNVPAYKKPDLNRQLRNTDAEITSNDSWIAEESKNSHETISYTPTLTEYGKKLQTERESMVDYRTQTNAMLFKTAEKLLNGDFAPTEAQKQLIEENSASIRGPVFALLDEASKEAERTGESINKSLDGYMQEIRNTGVSMGAALNAIGDRIEMTKQGLLAGVSEEESRLAETGASVKAALQGVRDEINATGGKAATEMEKLFSLRRTMAKQDMEDFYKEQRNKTALQATQMGRSMFDPQFQAQLQDNMLQKIDRTNLALSEQESMLKLGLIQDIGGKLESVSQMEAALAESQGLRSEALGAKRTAIEERTGAAQEDVSAQRAALAERTGAGLENVALQRANVAGQVGAQKQAIAGQKAAVEENIQNQASQLRQQYGYGIPAQMLGIGMQVGQYTNAIQQQALQNTAAAAQMPTLQQDRMYAERAAQPTTTTTTSGGVFGDIMGGLGVAAGAAGSIMGGYGAMSSAGSLASILRKGG